VLPDGRYYAAGEFSAVNGYPRTHLVRFNADDSLDLRFVPVEIDGFSVNALARQTDGRLLVGGRICASERAGAPWSGAPAGEWGGSI